MTGDLVQGDRCDRRRPCGQLGGSVGGVRTAGELPLDLRVRRGHVRTSESIWGFRDRPEVERDLAVRGFGAGDVRDVPDRRAGGWSSSSPARHRLTPRKRPGSKHPFPGLHGVPLNARHSQGTVSARSIPQQGPTPGVCTAALGAASGFLPQSWYACGLRAVMSGAVRCQGVGWRALRDGLGGSG